MKGKWMYNLNDSEMWQGDEFNTKEDAIKAGRKELKECNTFTGSFQVGQVEKVSPTGVDVDFILEDVAENTADGMEAGEDYLCDVTKEDKEELEQKLNDVLFAWMKEHKYEPNFFKIENVEEISL